MKNIISILFVFVLCAGVSSAEPYLRLGASYLFSYDYDSEASWEAVIGYGWGAHAVEVQTGVYGFDDDVNGFETEFEIAPAILINYVHRFGPETGLRYEAGLGAGVGVSSFELSPEVDGEDAIFVGQAFGRALWPLSESWSVIGEYRLMFSGQADEGEEHVDAQFIHGPALSLGFSF